MKNSKFSKAERKEIIRYARTILGTFSHPSMYQAMRYAIKYHMPYWRTRDVIPDDY